ncbi:hypothetical protein GPOL_c50280 [Gordonia polyisoprenivorans VH2]|uniref:Uncharacterized protein n=1 Tax=Gordonia polyisoprenivorans (strain DSM 44266 / VH2) TaxID=1112204 RepID=H6N343_GORPV|nr:hypothetical protein GPOL_c50280 [Gordonia polyisoprenivorans VH2]
MAESSIGDRVIAGLVPRSALEQPDHRQRTAVEEPVSGQRLDRVCRAGRLEPTCRQSQGRDPGAIQLDDKDQRAPREQMDPSHDPRCPRVLDGGGRAAVG